MNLVIVIVTIVMIVMKKDLDLFTNNANIQKENEDRPAKRQKLTDVEHKDIQPRKSCLIL